MMRAVSTRPICERAVRFDSRICGSPCASQRIGGDVNAPAGGRNRSIDAYFLPQEM